MHFTEEMKFLIVGHRGLPGVKTENTLESFRSAFNAGADAVELDVQLSSDGVPVVYHDFDMKRLHGSAKKIGDTSYDEILKTSSAKGSPVPKLEDLFVELPSGNFFIELKTIDNDGTISKNDPAEKVVELIRKYRMEDSAVVISFNPMSLKLTVNAYPGIKIGLDYDRDSMKMFGNKLFNKTTYGKEIDFLLPDFGVINFSSESPDRSKFKIMMPWTVNDRDKLLMIRDAGMKGVITNKCDEFVKLLKRST
ncbi:MAG: glycerophosphodiester phosphodiesterase [Thermoplasmata archaeon]